MRIWPLVLVVACAEPSLPPPVAPRDPPIAKKESALAPFPGKILFATRPAGDDRALFRVGEPIYGTALLDEPMRALAGPNLTGTTVVTLVAAGRETICGHATWKGESEASAKLLASSSFTLDVVRSPFPSKVRSPDVDYLPECFDAYETAALKKEPMTIEVRVTASTFDGRVEKTLASRSIAIESASDPEVRLMDLRRRFADEATMKTSLHPELDLLAMAAVRSYALAHRTTSFDPIGVALSDPPKRADVAFRRPDGTCFVQPDMPIERADVEVRTCKEDAEASAIRAAIVARARKEPDDATAIDVERAMWETARESYVRTEKLHDSHVASDADLEKARGELDVELARLHRLVPGTNVTVQAPCPDAMRLVSWPAVHAKEYEISCTSVAR